LCFRKSKYIILSDQRKLSYGLYGAVGGYPIIYFHGFQSSRFETHYDMSFATMQDLMIITIDRSVHGQSDFNPQGTILSFAKDIKQLLAILNIKDFSIVGMSAGALFAYGLAAQFNVHVKSLSIISGYVPFIKEIQSLLNKEVRILLKMAKYMPWLLKLMLRLQHKQLQKQPQKALKSFLKIISKSTLEDLFKQYPALKQL
jgi:pimeloyl-ACP methyl ester carboxylesterase